MARQSDGMELCIIDELYGRIFAKARSRTREAWHDPWVPPHGPACAVGDASVKVLQYLRRGVETDKTPPLPLTAQLSLRTARGLLGKYQPVAGKEAAQAEPEFQ